MGFSRQEYWSWLPCRPPPGDLPNPRIEPRSPTLQADSLPSRPAGKSIYMHTHSCLQKDIMIHIHSWASRFTQEIFHMVLVNSLSNFPQLFLKLWTLPSIFYFTVYYPFSQVMKFASELGGNSWWILLSLFSHMYNILPPSYNFSKNSFFFMFKAKGVIPTTVLLHFSSIFLSKIDSFRIIYFVSNAELIISNYSSLHP